MRIGLLTKMIGNLRLISVFIKNNLMSWGSKKQSIISRSSNEVKYRCLALLATELVRIYSLLNDLYINMLNPPIL